MNYNLDIAKEKLSSILSVLQSIFYQVRDLKMEIARSLFKIEGLDKLNPAFFADLNDTVKLTQRRMSVLQLLLVFILDYVLLMSVILILGQQLHLPKYVSYFIPGILVTTEIVVCFFAWRRKSEHQSDKASNFGQYLILFILFGATAFSVFYDFDLYIPGIDKTSFAAYIWGPIVLQTCILAFSTFLHLSLIKNTARVADATFFFIYFLKRKRLSDKVSTYQNKLSKYVNVDFLPQTHAFLLEYYSFQDLFPEQKELFKKVMEQGLIDEINNQLGKSVL